MRNKYLWRAIAIYPTWTTTRHFQSKSAAYGWAKKRLAGYEEDRVWVSHEITEYRDAIPPAESVEITRSEPIQWP